MVNDVFTMSNFVSISLEPSTSCQFTVTYVSAYVYQFKQQYLADSNWIDDFVYCRSQYNIEKKTHTHTHTTARESTSAA
jgi:hypothetical protein